MTTSSSQFGPEFVEVIIDSIIKGVEEATKFVVHLLWSTLLSYLKIHWLTVVIVLFSAFVVFTVKAMFGRWGSLGSFLYNFFYFGTLFVVGLIWGPEIFLGDFFKAICVAILYPVCYFLVGYILDKMKIYKK